ncbi:MAG: heavy metal-responsive transcriptional regulator [Silicimonas sp.]|nr:heavy metal-responsive transcriptional regulator [Silicimonas sp.]
MSTYRIGELSERLGLSADTLRYYEKIRLLPRVARNSAGQRLYGNRDISRLQFIQRAQRMNFTLSEIGQLLEMRENPQKARAEARKLTQRKLAEIGQHLDDLTTLRNELQLLVNLCRGAEAGCPIIECIDGEPDARS